MYAVIETGGKQYRVEVGTELEVELLDVEPGQSITLDRVLLVADGAEAAVGTPIVDGAAVEAEVVGATRGDKVIAFKYRPKARRRVKKGHRQDLTVLRIADIRFGGKSAADDDKRGQGDEGRRAEAPRGGRRPAGRRGRRARREAQGRRRAAETEAEAPRPRPTDQGRGQGRPPRPTARRRARGRGRGRRGRRPKAGATNRPQDGHDGEAAAERAEAAATEPRRDPRSCAARSAPAAHQEGRA